MGGTTSNPYVPEESNPNYHDKTKDPTPPKAQVIIPAKFMSGQQASSAFDTTGLQAMRYGGQSNPHF